MNCRSIKTYSAWDQRIITKLPAILTHKYAVDKFVISFLWSRTLGNSQTALQNCVFELHSEHWLKRNIKVPCPIAQLLLSLLPQGANAR